MGSLCLKYVHGSKTWGACASAIFRKHHPFESDEGRTKGVLQGWDAKPKVIRRPLPFLLYFGLTSWSVLSCITWSVCWQSSEFKLLISLFGCDNRPSLPPLSKPRHHCSFLCFSTHRPRSPQRIVPPFLIDNHYTSLSFGSVERKLLLRASVAFCRNAHRKYNYMDVFRLKVSQYAYHLVYITWPSRWPYFKSQPTSIWKRRRVWLFANQLRASLTCLLCYRRQQWTRNCHFAPLH